MSISVQVSVMLEPCKETRKQIDKKRLRGCLLFQRLFSASKSSSGSGEEGELRQAVRPGLFLFRLSGLCENTFQNGRSLIASIE